MKHIIKNDMEIYVKRSPIGGERGHTNMVKLNQNRILRESYDGAFYQLKKGDEIAFNRTNTWNSPYYNTPCGVEFKIDYSYDWFVESNLIIKT